MAQSTQGNVGANFSQRILSGVNAGSLGNPGSFAGRSAGRSLPGVPPRSPQQMGFDPLDCVGPGVPLLLSSASNSSISGNPSVSSTNQIIGAVPSMSGFNGARGQGSQVKSAGETQAELLSNMTSIMAPMLASLENSIIARMNASLQQQQNILQQVVAGQQHQQGSFDRNAEKQDHALQQAASIQLEMQAASDKQGRALQQTLEELQAFVDKHAQLSDGCATAEVYEDNKVSQVPEVGHREMQVHHRASAPAKLVQDHLSTPLLRAETVGEDGHSRGENALSDELRELSKRSIHHRMAALFPRVEDLKITVHSSLHKMRRRDVEDFYCEEGYCQALARSDIFKNIILLVIVLSTIWIAIDTDYNKASDPTPFVFVAVDNLFCAVFSFEIVIRFMSFKRKMDCANDPWFVFDASLVSMMVWETWIMVALLSIFSFDIGGGGAGRSSQILRMFRLVRLVRVARATRLLKYSPELLTLAWGMVAGIRSVIVVLCFLLLIIYVFAIIFTMALSGTEVGHGFFDNVPQSMNSLLLQVLCGADSTLMHSLMESHWVYYLLFLLFVLFSNLTLMNMLIGILCDVVSGVSREAKEEVFIKEMEAQISRLAKELDIDSNGRISRAEFDIMIQDPVMTSTFSDLGVDVVGVANFARFIYDQCDEIPYMDFGRLVSEYRGNRPASVKDIMEVRRYMTMELLSLESRIN